ncbi:hypothetical protein PR048_006743 [Dryococelus australis]|uniref:Uncharacterized protein n=1 Tax=Dryococelus australis TaxID=614101 RepID=A0ABQ9IBV0_9NEOP|nr:hypothetical protein PR048_006743 [Dryococelus australis]
MASLWGQNRIKCADYGHVHKKVFYKTSKRPDFIVFGDLSDVFPERFPNERVNSTHPLLHNEEYEPGIIVATEYGSDTSFVSENEELQHLNTTASAVGVPPD